MPFGWPVEEFKANRSDIEGNFFETMERRPEFAERVHAAKRETRFIGSAELPGYFRKPYGPGWALVGDAGYHKNPITAMGHQRRVSRRASWSRAPSTTRSSGRRSFEDGMGDYQRDPGRGRRSRSTSSRASSRTMAAPPPELQQLIGAMQGNQEAQDGFVSVQAATLPAPEFFAPENVGRIMAGRWRVDRLSP